MWEMFEGDFADTWIFLVSQYAGTNILYEAEKQTMLYKLTDIMASIYLI